MIIQLTLERRVTCIANETIVYEVDKVKYDELIADGNSAEEALSEIRGESEAEVISYVTDVVEITQEHESSVTL